MKAKRNYEGVPVPRQYSLENIKPGGPMPDRISRPTVGHGKWRERTATEPGPPGHTKHRHIREVIKHKAWNRVTTALNREAWNGDPSIRPPPLTKPTSSGSYGECPDDRELPWHLRQKRKP